MNGAFEMLKSTRPLLRYLLPALLWLGACSLPQTQAPNRSGASLDQVVLPGQATAPRPATDSEPLTGQQYVRNQLVWQVTPAEQSQPVSYLVGTIHAELAADYRWPAAFVKQIEGVAQFWMESDLEQIDDVVLQTLEQALNPSQNLPETLGAADWQALLQRLKPLGLPEQILPFLRPWYLNLMISAPPQRPEPEAIMDMRLRRQAETAQIAVRYLESPSELLEQLQTLPEAEHLALLKASLARSDSERQAELETLFATYNRRDLERLAQQEAQARAESALYHQFMVQARNQKWLEKLLPVLARQPIMVAVGALHMVGPDGLVLHLRQQGFSVTEVTYAATSEK